MTEQKDAVAGHTPGLWGVAGKPCQMGWPVVSRPSGRMICDLWLAPRMPEISQQVWADHYREVEANGRLIVAAPDLLAFAVALDSSWTETFPDGPAAPCERWPGVPIADEHRALWAQCRAAIARATGEQS